MKKIARSIFTLSLLIVFLFAGSLLAAEITELKTAREKSSYTIGYDIGRDLKFQDFDIDPEILFQGFKDSYSGKKALLSDQEMSETIKTLQQEMVKKSQERSRVLSEQNKKEGAAFLEENRKKEGVITRPSGLQYKVIREGTGPTPTNEDKVVVDYRGTLIDGREFDSSYKRGKPLTIPLQNSIPGWSEAMQLMQKGAKWKLFIPPSLAYGENQQGPIIGPNSVVIFEVELLDIVKDK